MAFQTKSRDLDHVSYFGILFFVSDSVKDTKHWHPNDKCFYYLDTFCISNFRIYFWLACLSFSLSLFPHSQSPLFQRAPCWGGGKMKWNRTWFLCETAGIRFENKTPFSLTKLFRQLSSSSCTGHCCPQDSQLSSGHEVGAFTPKMWCAKGDWRVV